MKQSKNFSPKRVTLIAISAYSGITYAADLQRQLDKNTADNQIVTVLGADAIATQNYGTSIGPNANSSGPYATAIGTYSNASKKYATAIGTDATSTGESSTSVGIESNATAPYSTATGAISTASGNNSIATGSNATAMGNNSVAIGHYAISYGKNSVALGANSMAKSYKMNSKDKYLNEVNQDVEDGVISVGKNASIGNKNIKRRITNVSPGIDKYDVVNVGQLDVVYKQTFINKNTIKTIFKKLDEIRKENIILHKKINILEKKHPQAKRDN